MLNNDERVTFPPPGWDMNFLYDFFIRNMYVVLFFYGLVSFAMGLAIFFKRRSMSTFRLSESLWLLGAFGISHGLADWGHFFIPLQATGDLAHGAFALRLGQTLLTGLSFGFLLMFGTDLVASFRPHLRPLRWAAPVLLAGWLVALAILPAFYPTLTGELGLKASDVLARYFLAFPGSLATAWAFRLQRQAGDRQSPHAARFLDGTTYSFILYALAGGLLVPSAAFPPANMVNADWFFTLTGFPVAALRMAGELAMAYCVIRVLDVFDLENQRRVEQAQRRQSILEERERISREIHDGAVQSLYAIGLSLENTMYLIDEDRAAARGEISRLLGSLDQVIERMREYIINLKAPVPGRQELGGRVAGLIREFQGRSSGVEVRFGEIAGIWLANERMEHVMQILREAISNAIRHAGTPVVRVEVNKADGEVEVLVTDNGCGFDPKRLLTGGRDSRQGLGNMQERAKILGGRLQITTKSGEGTRVSLRVPYGS